MMQFGYLVNLIVTLSNIPGFFVYYKTNDKIILLASIASVLMHLSEQKHGLPGIYPFNKFSNEFLWMDRIMAYISVLNVLYNLYLKWYIIPNSSIIWGLTGLFLNFVSEVIIKNEWLPFTFAHGLWHIYAYTSYYDLVYLISL
jgi:hypothetical protein